MDLTFLKESLMRYKCFKQCWTLYVYKCYKFRLLINLKLLKIQTILNSDYKMFFGLFFSKKNDADKKQINGTANFFIISNF